ncbi:MAG: MFS transporter [Desulfobacterales bacterium]|nr:MFS transporter [Desulfobacterales bacterium]
MSTNAPAAARLSPRRRKLIISASLLALFLGALDALVMSAAMPTVVAELGGLDLFSWVYSAYLLTRTVALPLFGKLADIYRAKTLYVISILIFIAASLAAGFAPGMTFLIFCRALQGLGAGGTFALVNIVLTEISAPEERGKTLSLGSFVWGLASVLGPTLGGFIVAYFSWRWIFFINVPLGILSLAGVARHLVELRRKREGAKIDIAGAAALTATVLCLLFVFLLGGQAYAWLSPPILALAAAALGFGVLFAWAETRARDPVLPIGFFRRRGFSAGNAAVFLSSFAIFAFFGFAPLFIQGALGKSPVEVGTTVLALSLGWSIGSLILGRLMNRIGARRSSIAGALILAAGCALTLSFSTATQTLTCFLVFGVVGTGMGFVALATVIVVQDSVDTSDLGVATASHQFARNLGGTIGVGICGGIFTVRLARAIEAVAAGAPGGTIPPDMTEHLRGHADSLFRPDIQAQIPAAVLPLFQQAVGEAVTAVFGVTVIAAIICLAVCGLLPREATRRQK